MNSQAHETCSFAQARKLDKSKLTVHIGAVADRNHKAKPVIVGRAACPRVFNDSMNDLPWVPVILW